MINRLCLFALLFTANIAAQSPYGTQILIENQRVLDYNKFYRLYYPINSVSFVQDEFLWGSSLTSGNIGALGWLYTSVGAASGGTTTALSSNDEPSGYFSMSSGTASGAGRVVYLNSVAIQRSETFIARVRLQSITDCIIVIGISDAVTASPTTIDHASAAIQFGFDPSISSNWLLITESGGTRVQAVSSSSVSAGTWYNLRVVVSSAGVKFYINGVFIGENTTGIPNAGTLIRPMLRIVTNVASEKLLDIGYFSFIQENLGRGDW